MKAVVFTLGCKVNECESASLIRGLEERGYEVSDELGAADLYIINTCAVTAEAEKKSRQAIARARKFSADAKIIVCGCAAQNHPESFLSRQNVALVSGATAKGDILSLLDETGSFVRPPDGGYEELLPPLRLKTRAFVKVQDGCDRFCSYCIIPFLRGRSRSRALSSVIEEVKNNGAEETVIVGIDLSSYRDGGNTLSDLLRGLSRVPARIRLGSLEVSAVTRELLSVAKDMENFAPHFHLSLQSGDNKVLRSMNRRYTREEYLAACSLIYEYFPEAAITTDIIVGFPTEGEEEFSSSLRIVEEAAFAHVHCFPYSPRAGTLAARKYKDLPPSVKKERLARLLAAAEKQGEAYRARFLGKEGEIVRETFEDGYTQGYSANYMRVYLAGDIQKKRVRVRYQKLYKDGVLAEEIK